MRLICGPGARGFSIRLLGYLLFSAGRHGRRRRVQAGPWRDGHRLRRHGPVMISYAASGSADHLPVRHGGHRDLLVHHRRADHRVP